MARWNKDRRVLEHEHTEFWSYKLVETGEPNLQRNVFPYDEVSRIDFDHKYTVLDPARNFYISDSTFRDGQQARSPYTVKQIEDIYNLLHRIGGRMGVIRQSEFFLYSKRDKEAVEKCLELDYEYPEITGWIRAVPEDLQLVREMGLGETGILTSVSDYHIYLKLGLNRVEAMTKYLEIVRSALDLGVIPRCHFEDVTRADIYGFVIPYAIKLKELSEEYDTRVKVRLCDTLGLGVTYPSTSLPRSVPKLVRAMIEDAGFSGDDLEWHGHNDFHKALINASTAWLYGLSTANGTLLGFGERTGNTPIEALVMEYISLRGKTNGMNTRAITEMVQYFEREVDFHIPSNYPFVGNDFNATAAGVHLDGMLKNEEIYNIFDTKKILNRSPSIIITDKSGAAGVTYWINQRLVREVDEKVDKRHPGITKIVRWIQKQYDEGRITSISTREMEKLARRYLPDYFSSEFDRLKAKAKELAYRLLEDFIESPDIRSMDPASQEPAMQALLDANPFIQYLYVVDDQGRKITQDVTHVTEKAKFETRPQAINEDLSDREWFIEPMKDGRIHVTDFYTSRYTGVLCITVSGPIRNEDDEIKGILGLDMRFEDLARMEEEGT
ncbi:MAG: histone-lysine N-methyltransferase [Deltaproteobacteria bacterium]|nr:histone-lysine N-methyltransferase [Deltaproteobacteria bacterium]MBW2053288.1 histone-lysine N-methyltransferase [Deltaproteobacteria bacterium]MBW2140511.1 histone-lysine N-methyltransferase [Deltaproteobacteria bacterium]MBW2324035.1 histone-lysine N-methyltransferase [Deltaproteobacteria bacterium]